MLYDLGALVVTVPDWHGGASQRHASRTSSRGYTRIKDVNEGPAVERGEPLVPPRRPPDGRTGVGGRPHLYRYVREHG